MKAAVGAGEGALELWILGRAALSLCQAYDEEA